MAAPSEIRQLVETFGRNIESYRSGVYNETQVRVEFIDPFFKALGWDVHNEQGYAEAYKDVIHEDRVQIAGGAKAPDYCFRIGGTRKFFVEAKKPSVDVGREAGPAYQLRRYAWSAKLPLSIVTDFEEFAVYDCRVKPDKNDPASKARTFHYKYTDYADKWEEIAGIFSREAILKGSFDKYAESNKRKKGTAEVDNAFLEEIETWRELLAKNIALRNKDIAQRDLNHAVQATIDRIVFLRIAEDRGLEPENQLLALISGNQIYPRLCNLFRNADDRYNSGLFHFRKEPGRDSYDNWTLNLTIDDKVLKQIFSRLYYPESPYEFSVLPADILGQVYERFLGKVIRLKGKSAVVEEKPEVRKAGGVYYTPTYIVEYIVKHTVGTLVDGKTPDQVRGKGKGKAPIRVLDPACGSGSFLLGAYQFLLDWYLERYKEKPDKHLKGRNPAIFETAAKPAPGEMKPGKEYRLTTAERKRILLDHIYGVDIDPQAVEVTKLSLLLKVLEGENVETLNKNMSLFHERALPDLDQNIQCGNSLIGPDFYRGRQLDAFDEEELYRINVFDWHAAFSEVFKDENPGFDAVIGNPPWVSLSGRFRNEILTSAELSYLTHFFSGNTYMPNIYEFFVSQGLNLCRTSGKFSFIVPDRLGFNRQFIELRRRILSESIINSWLYKIPFPGITADTLIFVLTKGNAAATHTFEVGEYGYPGIRVAQINFKSVADHKLEYCTAPLLAELAKRTRSQANTCDLASLCSTTSGFGGKSSLITREREFADQIPCLKGDSIARYSTRHQYWFEFTKQNITGRTTDVRKLGATPKILLRKTGDRIVATLDTTGTFPEQSLYFLFDNVSKLDFRYLLALLNSRLLTAYYRTKCLTNRRSIAQVKKMDLDQIPIRLLDFCHPPDVELHDRMSSLAQTMLDLNRRLQTVNTAHEKNILQRQIDATDTEIDRLVYELYGVTDEETRIVEEAVQ